MDCKNCNENLSGQEKYCSNCGQKNIDKLNFKYLYEEILDNILNLDSKLLSTIKGLIIKPGFLSKEFIAGRRKKYVLPVRFYIIISVIFFFMVSMIRMFPDTNTEKGVTLNQSYSLGEKDVTVPEAKYNELIRNNELDSYISDSLKVESSITHFFVKQSIKTQNSKGGFVDVVLNQLSIFLLLFIPLIALVYKICFTKNKYSFVDHVVFNVHFNSFVMVLLILNELFKLFTDSYWGLLVVLFGSIFYLYKSIKNFYNRKGWVVLYKLFFLFVGYFSLALVFGFVLVLVSVIMT
jgi:hypothetical protein